MNPTWIPALLLTAACGGPTATSPAPTGGQRAGAVALESDYLLAMLPSPIGAGPTPPELERCRAIFERAVADYHAGAYARSADGFVRAAAILTIPPGRPYGDIAAIDRELISLDAAYAWLMAGERETGIATLDRLRRDGIASEADLAHARAQLSPRERGQ